MGYRRRELAAWTLGIAAALAVTVGVTGQESVEDVLEPRVTRAQLDQVIMAAELTRDQRMIVNLLYTDYDEGLQQLIQETDALADEYGRQEVQAAFAGRLHLPQAELNEKRRAVLEVFAEALPEADALLQDLFESIESILMPNQRPAYQGAIRDLQRQLLFSPLREDDQSYDYAGDGIDIVQLLHDAMSPGGELTALDPQEVSQTITWYEQQLNAVLVRAFAAHRDAAMERRIANIGRGTDRTAEAEQELVANWRVLFDLNRSAMDAIARTAAAELGPEADQRWRMRFEEAIYPWLYRPRKPDRFIGWLDRDGAVSPEVDAAIRTICEEYAVQRNELVAEAASLMLEARLDHGVIIHSMSDPSRLTTGAQRTLYQELLRNSGELSKLDADTIKTVEAMLDDGQRRGLERYLRSVSR